MQQIPLFGENAKEKKILWFDTETTGLKVQEHCMVQFAGIIQIGNRIEQEIMLRCSPNSKYEITDQAMEITGFTREQMAQWPPPKQMYNTLVRTFDRYIDKYDRNDKFIPAGYNIGFDIPFIDQLFKDFDNPYLRSYITHNSLDVLAVVRFLWAMGIEFQDTENLKLETIAKYLGWDMGNAHDALCDIKTTMKLANYIGKAYI